MKLKQCLKHVRGATIFFKTAILLLESSHIKYLSKIIYEKHHRNDRVEPFSRHLHIFVIEISEVEISTTEISIIQNFD